MRRIVVCILAVMVLCLHSYPALARRDVSIDLRKVQGSVNIGDECSVKVNIDQVRNLRGINLSISFDQLRLEYKSTVKATLINDSMKGKVSDTETAGKIEYSATLETTGPGVDFPGGTILTFNFVAKSTGRAWIRLNGWDCSVKYQGGQPIINSSKRMINIRPVEMTESSKTNEPKKVVPQVPGSHLLKAGRALETSAGLRYAGTGLVLSGLGLSLSGNESSPEFGSILALGGTASGLASPFFIGKAGKQLVQADLGSQTQNAGIALEKYRKHYYGGLLTTIVGTGILIWGVSEDSSPGMTVGTILLLGGFLDKSLAPPHYLGSAGSFLCETDMDTMQKAGLNLKAARGNMYGSTILSTLGMIITAYGVSSDEDSAIYTGGAALVLASALDLVANIKIHTAGRELNQTARAMQ